MNKANRVLDTTFAKVAMRHSYRPPGDVEDKTEHLPDLEESSCP